MQAKIDISEQHTKQQQGLELRAEKKKQRDEDLRFVMSSESGRRFLWELLGDTGLYRTTFTGNSETFLNEGKRQIGLMLLAQITSVAPKEYMAMIEEQQHGG